MSVLGVLDWAVAAKALAGEPVSGDRHVLRRGDGEVLAGAIDGAGHGPEAAAAAERAQAFLERGLGQPLERLFEGCHAALRSTRGAAVSLARVDMNRSTLAWGGVGNVEGALVRARRGAAKETLLLRNGVVGDRPVPPRVATLPVEPGDTLVFVTDGVRSDFLTDVDLRATPRAIADEILALHDKGSDDALALVLRFQADA